MTTRTPNPTEAYQSYFGPAIFEPLSERVLAVAAPAASERVIDVACGTGILTRRAAAHVAPAGLVVGVDINPAMTETGRAIQSDDGSAPIEYREGDGTALDEPSGAYDVAYCQQGLQFFPDRAAGAHELRRVVRDGGRAVVAVWQGIDRHPLYAALADADRFVERLEYAYAAVVPAFAQDPAAFQAYLERIAADTKDVVEQYRAGDEIVVPMHANIAVAR